MLITMPIVIIHFEELFFEVIAIAHIVVNIAGRLYQYKGEMWLKTKSLTESIDKG